MPLPSAGRPPPRFAGGTGTEARCCSHPARAAGLAPPPGRRAAVAFHAEQRRVQLRGDGGVPGGAVEQATLTEAVARTEVHHGLAVAAQDDAAIHDGVEGARRRPLDHDVDPGGSGQNCAAEASCSKTICGTPTVTGRPWRTFTREASASARCALSASSPRRPRRHSRVTSKAAAPRITRLARSDTAATRTGARTAPVIIAATDTALKTPITRPSASRGAIRANAVSPTTSRRQGRHSR